MPINENPRHFWTTVLISIIHIQLLNAQTAKSVFKPWRRKGGTKVQFHVFWFWHQIAVKSFMTQSLYTRERTPPPTHWTGGWVGFRGPLKVLENRKPLASVGNRTSTPRLSNKQSRHYAHKATPAAYYNKTTYLDSGSQTYSSDTADMSKSQNIIAMDDNK